MHAGPSGECVNKMLGALECLWRMVWKAWGGTEQGNGSLGMPKVSKITQKCGQVNKIFYITKLVTQSLGSK